MKDELILTNDLRMKDLLRTAENVAASRASVLIGGESGTGKELLARFIHMRSSRAQRAFVAINCAAVPEGLLESELFGFEKGAFTGATHSKPGRFELANDGTLLLDEVGDIPLHLQAKLLRVLQEGEVERIGSTKSTKVNVRVLAATHRDLNSMVKGGAFREDLFYRLNVIPLFIPPLRERPVDIDLLAEHFLAISCEKNGRAAKAFDESSRQALRQYRWMGNVRELENIIERTVLLASGSVIRAEDIKFEVSAPSTVEPALAPGMTVSEAERLLIYKTLEFTSNNRTQAARLLGISVRTLRNKLHEYHEGGLL